MLPEKIHRYFWENRAENIDQVEHSYYIIERLLEHGDDEAIRWLLKSYSKNQVKEVVLKSRQLSRKTAKFWALLYELRKEDVTCLKRSSPVHELNF